MKWNYSRNTFAIILGILYMGGAIVSIILSFIAHETYSNVENTERRYELLIETEDSILLGLTVVLISILYIMAVVARFLFLIVPWLAMVLYVLYISCKSLYLWFEGAVMGGAPGYVSLIFVMVAVLSAGIQIGVYCFSYSLFKQIRLELIENATKAYVGYRKRFTGAKAEMGRYFFSKKT